jgi:cyanophycinase
MSAKRTTGTFVLVGGGEFGAGCRDFDADLLARSGADEVVVLPTAAAFEHPDRLGERATAYFEDLGAKVRSLPVIHRREAEDAENATIARSVRC